MCGEARRGAAREAAGSCCAEVSLTGLLLTRGCRRARVGGGPIEDEAKRALEAASKREAHALELVNVQVFSSFSSASSSKPRAPAWNHSCASSSD